MKKLFSLTLAAALALSLTACGGGGGSSSSGGASDSGSASSSSASSSADNSASGSADLSEAGPAFTTVSIGEAVALEGVDVELSTAGFDSGDKLGGNISVSTHSDSNKYFWLSGTMTNVGAETLSSFSIDSMVNIVFDDNYTYTGDLIVRSDMGPFAESEVLFWADVPPAMLERYETVKVQFAYNDGFEQYDWSAHTGEKTLEGYDHQYEFVQDGSAAPASSADAATIDAALQGTWSIGGGTFDFNSGAVVLTNQGQVMTGTYTVDVDSSSIKGTFVATNGNVNIEMPYEYTNGILSVYNNQGQALQKQ